MMSRLFLNIWLCCVMLCSHAQEVPFEQYQVPSNQCFHFETTSGSHVFIEEGALVSDKDSVLITYRELMDPVDMILHNVQMHVTMGGNRLQLESSGMFEVYALDDADTLQVEPGMRIFVQMGIDALPPVHSQGYRYNSTHEAWDTYQPFVGTQALQDDSELWGSSPVEEEGIVEVWDEDGFGWAEGFGIVDSIRREIFQSMEITDFGLFNYDQVVEGVEYQYLQASFQDDKGKHLKSTVYVVYDDINSVFYFPEYNWESQFFLIKDKSYKLFTISAEGEVSILTNYPDLSSMTPGEAYDFRLKVRRSDDDMRETLSDLLSTP